MVNRFSSRVTSPIWGPPPPGKQALSDRHSHDLLTLFCFACIVDSTCYHAVSAKTDLFDEEL